ncbi:hypothetical protein MITSMUL_04259 [Mitsuokella multacida DSM 20544]|uniref:Uncharacterized protein n=1 Tax=Mitsuokella multacida DSM 20544 TaxID=500635 RepID=C9KM24_9FIRM|nr:hypothetical protein MITSMUL_04259 [Mitsuokella multacida DSM 20544]
MGEGPAHGAGPSFSLSGPAALVPAGKTGNGSSDIMKDSLSLERMKT